MPASPEVAAELLAAVANGDFIASDDLQGKTDCPDGCVVEPDGRCPHGWASAAISAGAM